MNANAKVRMLVGCSILVSVCQSAAYAGGPGGMGGSHLGAGAGTFGGMSASHFASGVSHASVPASAFKVPTGNPTTGLNFNSKINSPAGQFVPSTGSKIQAGGISLKDKLSVSPGTFKPLPSSPTAAKLPGSGITPIDKLKLPPGLKVGTPIIPPGSGSTPPGATPPPVATPVPGGSTPPGGGATPPGGGSTSPKKDHDHDHFPYWLWFTPAFYGSGYGNWDYPSAPVSSQVSVSSPVVVEQTPVTSIPAVATATDTLTMKLGESYTIDNTSFGERAGELSLSISGLTLPVRVDNWTAREISFTLPGVGLAQATDGIFQISNADHQLTRAVPVTLVAAH